eukprot:gene10241-21359_t
MSISMSQLSDLSVSANVDNILEIVEGPVPISAPVAEPCLISAVVAGPVPCPHTTDKTDKDTDRDTDMGSMKSSDRNECHLHFDWEGRSGHKKIIIVGGSGHGKSTFINALFNYFNNNKLSKIEALIRTEYLAPVHGVRDTERLGNTTESVTQGCTPYTFYKPGSRDTSITFIDTPGLADTRGSAQDDINMEMILQVAAAAERDRSLTGIIMVMKGSENRKTLSIETVAQGLRSNIPQYILENIVAVFTKCRMESSCQ